MQSKVTNNETKDLQEWNNGSISTGSKITRDDGLDLGSRSKVNPKCREYNRKFVYDSIKQRLRD